MSHETFHEKCLRSFRAVDNQVYVSMCSPARDMKAGYHAVSNPVLEDVTFI